MNNPILFKNVHFNWHGDEMRLMYFYKDKFFMEMKNGTIAVMDAENLDSQQLRAISEDKEQQTEVKGDTEVLTLLDDVLAAIEKEEGDIPYGT